MKLTVNAYLSRNNYDEPFKFNLCNKDEFLWKLREKFGLATKLVVRLTMTITRSDTKSMEQLGYYYSEVLPKVWIAYKELGWKLPTIEAANELLKEHAGFYDDIINEKTGETKRIIRSKSGNQWKIDEMAALIDYAINEVCANACITVNPPKHKKNYDRTKSF